MLIDDSYNANPDSVRAAIDLLAGFAAPRVLVLGDMGEVGDRGPEFHREVGALCPRARHRCRCMRWERMTRETVAAFGDGGTHFDDVEALLAALTRHGSGRTTVLVKGSRFMRMERVVQALTEAEQGAGRGSALSAAGTFRMAGARHPGLQRLLLPDAARRAGGSHGAAARARGRVRG